MIQPLRVAHRRAFVALAFALPAILIGGLAARRPKPLSGTDTPAVPVSARLLKGSESLWQRHSIRTEFYGAANPNQIDVILRSAQPLNEPDLLLYWTSTEPQGDTLPALSRLLGGVVPGKVFEMTLDEARAGHLVLFSGAHRAVVDTAPVEKLP